MIRSDFHMHTTFCDGKNTAEEMVLSAIEKGLEAIGFSGHSFLVTQESWTMDPTDDYAAYRREIRRLKEKYSGQITIYCGIEQDALSPEPTDAFDYRIGSTHFIGDGERNFAVDASPAELVAGVDRMFGGDMYAAARRYFELEGQVLEKTHADIIGHFDLITKYNEGNAYFDTSDPRYRNAAFAALEQLLPYGVPFEVNTGAISRGWRSAPYPELPFLDYIAAHGGSFVLSSDSHKAETIAFAFTETEKMLLDRGYPVLNFRPGNGRSYK